METLKDIKFLFKQLGFLFAFPFYVLRELRKEFEAQEKGDF